MNTLNTNFNPLTQRRRDPIPAQGEITGKAFVDAVEIAERRENSADAYYLANSYPGGANDDNLMVMPGELVFGLRKRSNYQIGYHGEPNEYGFTSMAGLFYGNYGSDDAMMRDYYFMGVAKTEFRVGNSDQPESGFSFLRAGSFTIINNGPADIYAGDLVGYRFPLNNKSIGRPTDSALGKVVPQNMAGTPNTKYLAEVIRFDYTDFTTSIAGALDRMTKTRINGGISDISYKDTHSTIGADIKKLSDGQEEAVGYKFGIMAIIIRAIASLNANYRNLGPMPTGVNETDIARQLGLFDAGNVEDKKWFKLLSDIFVNEQVKGTRHYTESETRTNDARRTDIPAVLDAGQIQIVNDNKADIKHLMLNVSKTLCGSIAGSWHHKSSRVIGKAMKGASTTQSLDVMIGHWRRG